MSYFVEVQAVRSEVGSLVHEAAIFRSDTEVLDDIEIDAATVYERGLGLLVDAGVCRLRIIGWIWADEIERKNQNVEKTEWCKNYNDGQRTASTPSAGK